MALQQYNGQGQNSRYRTRAEMSASTGMRANRMGLPEAWGKIFTECTWNDVAALAALDITNSARQLSVVDTPRLPTYRDRLFALGSMCRHKLPGLILLCIKLWQALGRAWWWAFLAVLGLSGPLTSPARQASSVVECCQKLGRHLVNSPPNSGNRDTSANLGRTPNYSSISGIN